jgi:prepilin-type N-terminal cleavage/methylation domain-containing protein
MKNKKGFTLIELLVVVLIIGILAAIALPQYKRAVFKARFINVLSVAESLKKAEELYYLVNGTYSADTTKLDWNFKENCNLFSNAKDLVACDKYFMIDPINGGGGDGSNYIRIIYCPGYSPDWSQCVNNLQFHYLVWLDHSSHPGLRQCVGITDEGKKLCKMLGF